MNREEAYKKIGRNIQNQRKKQGYTQESFAELMNVSWSYVSKVEAGYLNLSIGKLVDISNYLKIDLVKLIEN